MLHDGTIGPSKRERCVLRLKNVMFETNLRVWGLF